MDPSSGQGLSIGAGAIKINFSAIRPGWYAVIASEIKNNEITNNKAVIYLNEPPLVGIENTSSITFKGVGAVTAKSLIQEHKEIHLAPHSIALN